MVENYVKAEKDYMDGMKYKDIAEKYDVSINTVKSWKTRHKWSKDAKKKSVHTKEKRVHTKKEVIEPVVESEELTDKQRLFCIYYIKYFNATKAYQKAYESAYTTAMSEGYRHLRNPKISAEIDRMRKERLSEKKLSVDDVLQKYIDIAFADIGDFVEVDSNGFSVMIKPLEEMDSSIIGELSNTENGIKLKLVDKMKALDMLAKYTDILSENDKKRLQEEKLKVGIDKTNAEIEKLSGNDDDDLIKIMITRKEDR